jgi:hypothetical protein
MESRTGLEEALAALTIELEQIDKWSSGPHLLYAREMQRQGQLELDFQQLNKKLQDVRDILPTAKRPKFDACVKDITVAFGGMIIHAAFPYSDQRDVMRGWQEVWPQLDNSLKGVKIVLATLSAESKRPGRSGGSGGSRVDLFNIDRGCA